MMIMPSVDDLIQTTIQLSEYDNRENDNMNLVLLNIPE